MSYPQFSKHMPSCMQEETTGTNKQGKRSLYWEHCPWHIRKHNFLIVKSYFFEDDIFPTLNLIKLQISKNLAAVEKGEDEEMKKQVGKGRGKNNPMLQKLVVLSRTVNFLWQKKKGNVWQVT